MILTDAETYITGVQVGEISVQCLKEPHVMSAKYALVSARDLRDGRLLKSIPEGAIVDMSTHGACSAYQANWSPETIQKLRELINSMEKDLLRIHFKEDKDAVQRTQGLVPGEDEEAAQV